MAWVLIRNRNKTKGCLHFVMVVYAKGIDLNNLCLMSVSVLQTYPTMPASSQQSGPDSRFQHLLQPIRDLTKNWNVDIASQLDEYLAEVCVFLLNKLNVDYTAAHKALIEGHKGTYHTRYDNRNTRIFPSS